jgi:tRNA modification GTPase
LVESIGVDRTRARIEAADFVLLILDAGAGEQPEDAALRAGLLPDRHITVWNKWDLRGPDESPRDGIAVSAATRWNIERLEDILADRLAGESAPLPPEAAAVTHARHQHALATANDRLGDAMRTLEAQLPADFVSIDVRGALQALGEITGETANEDIINEIFSRFCIGK